MDVARTIEYILQMQAKAEARMAKAEERMDKFDRRLEAIGKLLQTGMKMFVKIEKNVSDLTEAQRQSDRKFDRLIALWSKRPPNGHRPK